MKTVAFHTFGCKVNQYETEELRVQLRLGQFTVVPLEVPADVVVINSCSVTADADNSCRQLVRKVLREQPETRVVVTGCYAERAPGELRDLSPRVEVFGNHEKPLIALALGVPTACVEAAAQSGVTGLADRSRAYIKVQDGCDAHCTYCIIPKVRPHLVCRSPELIIREARTLLARGFREIVLTGVRLGRYAWQDTVAWDLTTLVEALLGLPGDFRIRLSSIEVTEVPDAILGLATDNPKLCPFFHLPLQSGDDDVLKRMGRWYSATQYRDRIHTIKAAVPGVALSADVIVGFPGEGEEHFARTMELLDSEGFSRVHAFRYSVRPGTPAEKLPGQVEARTKSNRARRLGELDRRLRYRYAERFVGQSQRVLREKGGVGYTERYIRARVVQDGVDGDFEIITPTGLTSDAVLVS